MALVLLVTMATSHAAFITTPRCLGSALFANTPSGWPFQSKSSSGDLDEDHIYAELARCIESVSAAEASQAAAFDDGLRRRVRDVAAAEAVETEFMVDGHKKRRFACLPVVTIDEPPPSATAFFRNDVRSNIFLVSPPLGTGRYLCPDECQQEAKKYPSIRSSSQD